MEALLILLALGYGLLPLILLFWVVALGRRLSRVEAAAGLAPAGLAPAVMAPLIPTGADPDGVAGSGPDAAASPPIPAPAIAMLRLVAICPTAPRSLVANSKG